MTSSTMTAELPQDGLTVLLSDENEISINGSCQELTAQQVIKQIFHQLDIDYENCEQEGAKLPVSLWACGRNLRLQLMPDHNIGDIRDKMKTLIKNIPSKEDNKCDIVFRLARNGFYDGEDEFIVDKVLLRLLYFEAKTNIESNIYPITCLEFNNMINLRVIKDLIEKRLKNTDEIEDLTTSDSHRIESKTLAPMRSTRLEVPIDCPAAAKAIKSELTYKNTIRKKFLTRSVSMYAKRQESRTEQFEQMDLDELLAKYLSICRTLDCYGGFIFEGQMERSFIESITHRAYYDKKVSIIINKNGLHVVNMQCPVGHLGRFVLLYLINLMF